MSVKPVELANVCAIFSILRSNIIGCHQLELYVTKSLLLDSCSSPTRIIDECVLYGLLAKRNREFLLTDRGRQLAKRQQLTSSAISNPARGFLLKNVYLDTRSMPSLCQSFLLSFQVDSLKGTFVYKRSDDELEIARWLRIFYSLGLIYVDDKMAFIQSEHLGMFNNFLAEIRGIASNNVEVEANFRDEIGEFAEHSAVDYEIRRLRASGYPDLALLVQRISTIDRSAGYDVISRTGIGKYPEETLFIEVKGTIKSNVNFIWTRNERRVAAEKGENYWIYVFTHVNLLKESFQGPIRICNPKKTLENQGYILEPLDVEVLRKSKQ